METMRPEFSLHLDMESWQKLSGVGGQERHSCVEGFLLHPPLVLAILGSSLGSWPLPPGLVILPHVTPAPQNPRQGLLGLTISSFVQSEHQLQSLSLPLMVSEQPCSSLSCARGQAVK